MAKKFKIFQSRFIESSDPEGKDWDVCIIEKGTSKNGFTYTKEVLTKSVPLFEGAKACLYDFQGVLKHLPEVVQKMIPGGFAKSIVGWYSDVKYAEFKNADGSYTLDESALKIWNLLRMTVKEGGPGSGRYPAGSGANPKQSAFADKSPDEMHAYIQKQYGLESSFSVVPKLPIVKLPDGTKFRPEARTNTATGDVECSEGLFMRTGDDTSIGYKVSGTIEMGGWQAIVCHETAHVLDASRDVTNDPKFMKIQAAMESAAKSKSGYVSEYAMNSPEENFAESFAVYKLQPAWLEKNNPDMYNYIKKIK